MATTVTKALIGKEDISYGSGTFARTTSTGGTQDITKVPSGVEVFNVEDYGAAAGANSATGIQAAITAAVAVGGGIVYIPPATSAYLVETTITIPSNVHVVGAGGHGDTVATEIQGTGASGAVFHLTNRSASLGGVKISASAARKAGTGHGVECRDTSATVTVSRWVLRDIDVHDQPTDGFHIVSPELGTFQVLTATNCERYGFLVDDGTIDSQTAWPPFSNKFEQCRALTCGDVGWLTTNVAVSTFINCQALGCDAKETTGYQFNLFGSSNVCINLDIEDQQYADTKALPSGTQAAKSAPSKGINLVGNNIQIRGGHFSSLTQSILVASGSDMNSIEGIRVFKGVYATAQPHAIEVNSGATNTFIRVDDTFNGQATKSIQNQSTSTMYILSGDVYFGLPGTLGDFALKASVVSDGTGVSAATEQTISGGILNVTSGYHTVDTEADAASDSLSQVRDANNTAGNGQFVDGQRLVLRAANDARTVVLKHNNSAQNFMFMKSAADVTLDNETDTVQFIWDVGLVGWLEI